MDTDRARRALHARCRKLGIDTDTRQAMCRAIGGAPHSADLTPDGLRAVLDHLNRLLGSDGTGRPAYCRPGCEALRDKVEALLLDQGLPWHYLTRGRRGRTGRRIPSMAQRLAGVARLEWAQPEGWQAVVVALVKRGLSAAVLAAPAAAAVADSKEPTP